MRQIWHVILLKILVEMFRTGSSVCSSRYKMCKLRSCCSQTRAPVPKSEMNRAQPCNDHSHNHNTLHIVPEWKIHNGGLSPADRSEGHTGEEPPLQRSKNIEQQTTNGKILKILNEIYFMNTKYKHSSHPNII